MGTYFCNTAHVSFTENVVQKDRYFSRKSYNSGFSCTSTHFVSKDVFACLFRVHNTKIYLSRHEQVCLMRLVFFSPVFSLTD